MPKNKTALAGLIVLCVTFLCSLWMVRDSLCEVRYQDGRTKFLAQFVVYEAVR
ncbi:Hok/Gef family protein [Vibrio crassostreae]|uniref:Hok/Gef family protein n=1 Tax=Vibrio crassostreae TaxID=246167 RepID=UPI00105178EC|nr:Hok/Gef family protein [Vibrio crassostreae]TCT61893.1 Hok/gef family protein [Vibrio crassostreae]